MNIVYVGTLPPHPGGSAIVGGQLVEGFAARGHRVRAVAPITEVARAVDPYATARPGLTVARYGVPRFQTDSGRPDPAFRVAERAGVEGILRPWLAEDPPDVVVVGRETLAWAATDVASRRGVPVVQIAQTTHGGGAFSGALAGAGRNELFERFRAARLVIVVARHAAAPYRALGCRVEVVQNGVDTGRFRPGPRPADLAECWSVADEDIVVLHPSNLKAIKRPLDLVESAALALPREPRLRYLFVGDGEERPTIEARAAELGLGDRLAVTGWVDHSRMPDHLRLADLVAMPSEDEAMPLAYLEAQASGRVLVASDIAAAREALEDGVDDLLFRPTHVDRLAELTLELAARPARRHTIAGCARERACRRPVAQVVEEYLALLAEAAA